MKKVWFAILALMCSVFMFTGCPKETTSDATLKVVIKGISARTVFPDVNAGDLTDLTLSYRKSTASEDTVKTWARVEDITGISLDIGTYNFTLSAKCKGFNYSATVENYQVKTGENTVVFDLEFSEYVPEDMEGQGTIDHTFTVPADEKIKKVKAGLYKYNDEDELEAAYAAEEVTITDNEDGTYTVAYNNTVDSAEYVLKYFFYADDDATLLMDTYSVTVYVLKDITSEADESTDYLCSVYTVSYVMNNGSWAEGYDAPVQFTYDSGVTLPAAENITRAGYHFVKWAFTDSADAEAVETVTARASDIKVYAIWEADTDTVYTVKHWQQNITDDEYTLVSEDTEEMTGTTDTSTAAEAKEYTGFDALEITQVNIDGDGSAVVNVYYNRKIIYITLVLGTSTTETELDDQSRISGRYGAAVEVSKPVLASGGVFSGWINENNEKETLPAVFTEDRTFIADFISSNSAGISLNVKGIQDIPVNAVYSPSLNKIFVVADEGYTSYRWTVNGVKQASTTQTLDVFLNGSDNYNVQLTAKKAGLRYSTDVVVNFAKKAEEAINVGDIVLSDGAYVKAENYSSYIGTATPVGIVCKVNDDEKTGLMLGLCNSSSGTNSGYNQWAPEGTTGYSINFTAIQRTDFDGDTDGSDNWEEICKVDTEGAADPATNYPAFNYALTYAETAGLTETEYADGWYMPAIYELYNYVYQNKTVLNESLTAAGGTILEDFHYWSSSQYYGGCNYAWGIGFVYGNTYGYVKDGATFVCCLRSF